MVRRRGSPRLHALAQHLRGELIVFKKVGLKLVGGLVLSSYAFFVVFRRTSSYMQQYGIRSGTLDSGPLYDVGQDFMMKLFGLPDMALPDPDPAI